MYLFNPLITLILTQIGNSIKDFIVSNSATIILISTSIVILAAFILLFDRKDNDKTRLYSAFSLVILATFFIAVLSPFKDWNALITAALLTPIFAYFFNLLKDKQKLSSEKDKLVWEYKCRQLQQESDMLGNLLGELSIHAAAFKSPYFQKIGIQRWESSFKASVISESHALSIARYYTYVLQYNEVISKVNTFLEKKGSENLPDISNTLQAVKKAFLDAETFVYFMLTYDLGYLQQNYLKRPYDDFPLHENLMFRTYLEKCRIVNEDEAHIFGAFTDRNAKRFNKKTVIELNDCFHRINVFFKVFDKYLKNP